MVKEEKITKFTCEICGKTYFSKESAEGCESRPVSEDKGVKIGDIVLITQGITKGKKAKVEEILIYDRSWGHYAWERYWHTVGLSAKLLEGEGFGSVQLKFDDYELVKNNA